MEERSANAVKLFGEIFVPGASQLVEGNIRSGAAHFLLGGLLVAALAPAAPLLAGIVGVGVRLNSFSSSISGQNLWREVRGQQTQTETTEPTEPSTRRRSAA
jgi:hypothetical protein